MIERFIQAALMTCLLYSMAGLSPNHKIPPKTILPMSEVPLSMLNSQFHTIN
jgi:hypothetical protein